MAIWFEGEDQIDCSIERVKQDLDNPGELFVDVTRQMPGMTSVELVEQGDDFVTIKTNEGLMKRTNISKRAEEERVVMEFDETYEAGSKFTATSHFTDEFTANDTGVTHHFVMSDVKASGFVGFFYRKLGSAKMGKAFLSAYRTHFEKTEGLSQNSTSTTSVQPPPEWQNRPYLRPGARRSSALE